MTKKFIPSNASFLFILFLLGIFYNPQINRANAATLTLSPSFGNYSVGQTFSVNIILDTQGAAVDGIDIVYLNYNPTHLEIIDDNASQTGIQIAPGALMPMTLANTVNATIGKITFSQITAGGTTFTSSGAQSLAAVHFKVLKAINTQVYFDFVANGTADTNIASVGKDVLATVTNGNYGPSAQAPAPAPPTSPAPASSGGGGGGGGITTTPAPTTLESVQSKVTSVIAKIAALPTNPTASDLASIQAEITSILNELKSLQTPVSPTGFTFTKSLYLGLRDNDVRNLQQLLKSDPSIYPEALITGYYGPLTILAVERFQVRYNIVNSGSPETTGYGLVGPKTRTKLNEIFK